MSLPTEFANSLLTAAQILAAVLLYAWRLPHKPHFAFRVAGFWAALTALIVLTIGMLQLPPGQEPPALLSIGVYGLALVLCFATVKCCFDTNAWSALFCATSGYTLQNLASGISGQAARIAEQAFRVPAGLLGPVVAGSPLGMLAIGIFYVLIYALCWALLVRKISRGGFSVEANHAMLMMMLVVIWAVIGFDTCIKEVGALIGNPTDPMVLSLRATHAVVCCFVLYAEFEMMYNTHLKTEMTAAQQLAKDERKQYELSKETIESINVKCHDIRHQIRNLGEAGSQGSLDRAMLDDIAKEINVYDSNVTTANDALNVILTEKSLFCDSHGITLSCIADGKAVDFLSPTEIYSLFGNALDNAIEATEKVRQKERRRISLYVSKQLGMASIHVENYFEGTVTFGADGLPQTTKADKANHGLGTLSMRRTVEQHGGTLVASTNGDTYLLDIAIPLP